MDFIKKAGDSLGGGGGGGNNEQQGQGHQQDKQEGGGGFLGGLGNKMNEAAGGGKESEKNEDYLDKGKLATPFWSCLVTYYIRRRFCARKVSRCG